MCVCGFFVFGVWLWGCVGGEGRILDGSWEVGRETRWLTWSCRKWDFPGGFETLRLGDDGAQEGLFVEWMAMLVGCAEVD